MNPGQPVHIIGAEALCSAGGTLDTCMKTMLDRRTVPQSPALFASQQSVDFPVFSVSDKDLTIDEPNLTRTANLLLTSVENALQGGTLKADSLQTLRVGVCIGTSVGASLNFLDFYREWKDGEQPELPPIERYLASNPAEVIAERHQLSGPCQTVVNACTSGADAIGIAASWIRHGLCDAVIAGGADELSEISYNGFARLMITSPEACRPFDKDRKGLNLGEGAGVLIMASDGIVNDLKIPTHGQLAGYGTCGDAHHLTAPHPDARGLNIALDNAFEQADIKRKDITFINVHGTGTPTNDPVEGSVICEQFPGTLISATKGFTGHTLGAAGAIEAAFSVACLERGIIPSSQGFQNPDPEIGCTPVATPTPIAGRYALSQSLAFGGNNSVLIIRGSKS